MVAGKRNATDLPTLAPVDLTDGRRPFCVVVHDVTPFFSREIDLCLDHLRPLVGTTLSGAVVPCWRGKVLNAADEQQFRSWVNQFGELLLHGVTHQRSSGYGLVSLLTGRADEFSGMSRAAASQRLSEAQTTMTEILGISLRGFVPPAWQFPFRLIEVQPADIDYVMGFQSLISKADVRVPLASWSWDWGWLYGASRIGALLGAVRQASCPQAIPVIVLHPADVRRGYLPHALRLIRRFLNDGWMPILPRDILRCLAGRAVP